MKQLTMILYFSIAFILVGCTGNTNEQSTTDPTENSSILDTNEKDESTSELEESDTDDTNDVSPEKSVNVDSGSTASENTDQKEDKETLSQYSHEQIEYARIWLQLGPNQELDELYVQYIPAGEALNPDDETSASYPEDVIQLLGTRLVDGSVTYSGNGDGTINVYKVPLRWDGVYPAGEKLYIDMIENTELVYVNPGDNTKIIELIKLLHIK